MKLDKLVLDSMVQGQDVDAAYWKLLLGHKKRVELWQEATERRARIDKFTNLVVQAPHVASKLKVLKKQLRSLSDLAGVYITNELQRGMGNLSNAMLHGDIEEAEGISHTVSWGKLDILECYEGQQLDFTCDNNMRVLYSYADQTGWLDENGVWKVDADDGIVTLFFLDSAGQDFSGKSSIDEILTIVENSACVVLNPIKTKA
jgi:hypothetical protein